MAPWMALFPPGKGGGEGVAHGGKGKGILIHSLTEGRGMPLANRTTPANGDERAQVLPLLDAVQVRTGKRGRPRKRLKVIATEVPSRAHLCLVPEEISSPGGPVGAYRRLLRGISYDRHDPYLDPQTHSGIDSYKAVIYYFEL